MSGAAESLLATQSPDAVWRERVHPMLDGYLGLIFEGIVEEVYYRLAVPLGLPLVRGAP